MGRNVMKNDPQAWFKFAGEGEPSDQAADRRSEFGRGRVAGDLAPVLP
jgi:hypothetical protein